MAKDLELLFKLATSDQYEDVINIVAAHNGWKEDSLYKSDELDEDSKPILKSVTAPYFVCNIMFGEYFLNHIKNRVATAFDWYFGKSQWAKKQELMSLLDQRLTMTAEIKDVQQVDK